MLRAVVFLVITGITAPAARADYQPTSQEFTQIAQFLAEGGAAPGTAGMPCDTGCQSLMASQGALPQNARGNLIRQGLAALRTDIKTLPLPRVLAPVPLALATGWRIGNGLNAKFLHLGWAYEESPEWTQPTAHFCEDGCSLTRGVSVDHGQWFITWYFDSGASHGYQNTYVEARPDGCDTAGPPTPPWPFTPRDGDLISCRKNPCCWPPIYGENQGVGYATTKESDILQGAELVPYVGQPYDKWTGNWNGSPGSGDAVVEDAPDVMDNASGVAEELARDFIYDQLAAGQGEDPLQALHDTDELLESPHRQEPTGDTEDIVRDCAVPLWHYTEDFRAIEIYVSKALIASPENPPHPEGGFATTITPLDPDWTQPSLALHLFDEVKPTDSWVLMCWNVGQNRRFRPTGTEPDYWYTPGTAGNPVPVAPAAWGFNPMPAQ